MATNEFKLYFILSQQKLRSWKPGCYNKLKLGVSFNLSLYHNC